MSVIARGQSRASLRSAPHPAVERPIRELKGFAKVFLRPGESQETSVSLDRRSFAYFDSRTSQWKADPGHYEISIGAHRAICESSRISTLQ